MVEITTPMDHPSDNEKEKETAVFYSGLLPINLLLRHSKQERLTIRFLLSTRRRYDDLYGGQGVGYHCLTFIIQSPPIVLSPITGLSIKSASQMSFVALAGTIFDIAHSH